MVDGTTALNDELRVMQDVETLCAVLATRDAVPPISVGLFGRWGSGKSSRDPEVMRRLLADKAT